jgi:hypothetical protein
MSIKRSEFTQNFFGSTVWSVDTLLWNPETYSTTMFEV